MPGDVSQHRLIARPPGIPTSSYAPSGWRAIWGENTADKFVVNIPAADCPNTSHAICLGQNTTFDSYEFSEVRVIRDHCRCDLPGSQLQSQHRVQLSLPRQSLMNCSSQMTMIMKTRCISRQDVNIIRDMKSEIRRNTNVLAFSKQHLSVSVNREVP